MAAMVRLGVVRSVDRRSVVWIERAAARQTKQVGIGVGARLAVKTKTRPDASVAEETMLRRRSK